MQAWSIMLQAKIYLFLAFSTVRNPNLLETLCVLLSSPSFIRA